MLVEDARYEGGKLILSVPARDGIRLCKTFKPGEYDITAAKKKRSLDANAYAWVLIGKIADAIGIDKVDVYREAIRHLNEYEALTMRSDRVDQFSRAWESRGLGWQTEVVDSSAGRSLVFAYYGSSEYDTRAMSQLIDGLVQDAKALGIETIPEDKLNALLESWGAREEK